MFIIFIPGGISLRCLVSFYAMMDSWILRICCTCAPLYMYDLMSLKQVGWTQVINYYLIIVDCEICLTKYIMSSFQLHLVSEANFVPVWAMKMCKGSRCRLHTLFIMSRYGEKNSAWKKSCSLPPGTIPSVRIELVADRLLSVLITVYFIPS